MKVKGGLLDKGKMPAHKVLSYIVSNYREVSLSFKRSLLEFPFDIFEHFINEFHIYSQKRKGFIKCFIRHRSDRKSTRLNSSHVAISYAVFCLKKKKRNIRK